mgnify:CR=1 FL=1|tara:strand:- start:52 stop:651 length:600 start_codon:yes stop_codon:yes gene_type:complete
MVSYKDINKYENYGSWALWSRINKNKYEKGKDRTKGIADITIFKENIKDLINTDIAFVGLNCSKEIVNKYENFHSSWQDGRIRYAIQDTIFSGAYMTDIIKYTESNSVKVNKYLKDNPDVKKKNIELLEHELQNIGVKTIIAFGNKAYDLIKKEQEINMKFKKCEIYKVIHFSNQQKNGHIKLKNDIENLQTKLIDKPN